MSKKKKTIKKRRNPLQEMLSIGFIAFSLYLVIATLIPGSGGFIGGGLAGFFRAMFGVGGFLMPFFIIGLSLYQLLNDDANNRRMGIFFGLFLVFITFVHLLNASEYTSREIFSNNREVYFVLNGGWIGAILGNSIMAILGYAGAVILITCAIILLLMLATEKSFINLVGFAFDSISEKSSELGQTIKENKARDEEKRQAEYEEELAQRRMLSDELDARRKEKCELSQSPSSYTLKETTPEREFTLEENVNFLSHHNNGKRLDLNEEFYPKDMANEIISSSNRKFEEKVVKQNNSSDQPKFLLFNEEDKGTVDSAYTYVSPTPAPAIVPEADTQVIDVIDEQKLQEESKNFEPVRTPKETTAVVIPPSVPEPVTSDLGNITIKNYEVNEEDTAVTATSSKPSENIDIDYIFPPMDILKEPPFQDDSVQEEKIFQTSKKLVQTLQDFGVKATVADVSQGPTVTRYELVPGTGVKVSKISGLSDDIALNLAAKGIRIEAPIPGKSAVGIEIPNETPTTVYFRDLIESSKFKKFDSTLAFALGKNIAGGVEVTDIAKMPHMLIAGATGAGKSVCINTLIVSLLYKSSPDQVKLIMVDPKVVELSVYNGIPHLLIPVVTDPKKAAGALNWAVKEMLRRYDAFATTATRDLASYNKTLEASGQKALPKIVIIIDELADLMMAAPGEVEDSICRLAQMARAAGIHLIIATQRPSVDVITGLIKANVPSRLAFSVSSGTDSRTILDSVGAEKLLGRGDMLFSPIGTQKPMRIQGAFISDKEVEGIVTFLKSHYGEEAYNDQIIEDITSSAKTVGTAGGSNDDTDEFFEEAVALILEKDKASTSMLQRQFRIGYQRASRLIEMLENQGIIGPEDGSKPRKVLVTRMQWEERNQ